jgi:hypothetical protein
MSEDLRFFVDLGTWVWLDPDRTEDRILFRQWNPPVESYYRCNGINVWVDRYNEATGKSQEGLPMTICCVVGHMTYITMQRKRGEWMKPVETLEDIEKGSHVLTTESPPRSAIVISDISVLRSRGRTVTHPVTIQFDCGKWTNVAANRLIVVNKNP